MENRLIGSRERIPARREGSIFQEALQEAETPPKDKAGSDAHSIGQRNPLHSRLSTAAGVTSWKSVQVTASPRNAMPPRGRQPRGREINTSPLPLAAGRAGATTLIYVNASVPNALRKARRSA